MGKTGGSPQRRGFSWKTMPVTSPCSNVRWTRPCNALPTHAGMSWGLPRARRQNTSRRVRVPPTRKNGRRSPGLYDDGGHAAAPGVCRRRGAGCRGLHDGGRCRQGERCPPQHLRHRLSGTFGPMRHRKPSGFTRTTYRVCQWHRAPSFPRSRLRLAKSTT